MGNDNTVKWQGLSLQLPPSRLRPHFVKATVRVHDYPDGSLAVFWGPHRLADYDAKGSSSPAEAGRMTRFHRGGSDPGHAPDQNKNEADRS